MRDSEGMRSIGSAIPLASLSDFVFHPPCSALGASFYTAFLLCSSYKKDDYGLYMFSVTSLLHPHGTSADLTEGPHLVGLGLLDWLLSAEIYITTLLGLCPRALVMLRMQDISVTLYRLEDATICFCDSVVYLVRVAVSQTLDVRTTGGLTVSTVPSNSSHLFSAYVKWWVNR